MVSVEPLRGLAALTWLRLYDNQVRDVSPLVELHGLRVLDLRSNDIDEFNSLAQLTGLRELDVGLIRYVGEADYTPVMRQPPPGDTFRFAVPVRRADLAWLAELTALTRLSVSSLYVGDAEFLSALQNLEGLTMRNAAVAPGGLSRAAELARLRWLSVSKNWLEELEPLLDGSFRLAGLEAYGNCLDIIVDDSGVVLNAFVGAVDPDGLLVLLPQRPAEECDNGSAPPATLEALGAAVGDARITLLGEQSQGTGRFRS